MKLNQTGGQLSHLFASENLLFSYKCMLLISFSCILYMYILTGSNSHSGIKSSFVKCESI